MVSSETLLSYTDWTIPLTFHTGDYDKQFVDVISHNNKPIALLSKRLIMAQRKYTTTEKELLKIV